MFLGNIAYAQEGSSITIVPLLNKLNTLVLNPLIILLFAVAIVVFLWGIIQFLSGGDDAGENREKGKKNMLWGIIGLFIMFGVYGIITLILNTFGITFDQKPPYLP